MKLNAVDIEILKKVRLFLEDAPPKHAYICIGIGEVTAQAEMKELGLLRNFFMFWRRDVIREKWYERRERLRRGIQYSGLSGRNTMGTWLDIAMDEGGVNVLMREQNNRQLYKLARLCWLDRMIETGELA